MVHIEKINYTYLGVTVLMLMLVYYILCATKKYKKQHRFNKSNVILIQTNKGEIRMDTNLFEMHMNRIKDSIIELSNGLECEKGDTMRNYLTKTKNDTKSFISLNDPNNKLRSNANKIVDNYILKQHNMLKRKIHKKTILENDSTDYVEELKYEIYELLINIDLILFLVHSSICGKGKLDFIVLNKFMSELNNMKRVNINMDSLNVECSETSSNDIIECNTSKEFNANDKSGDLSQYVYDGTVVSRRKYCAKPSIHRRWDSDISHTSDTDFISNIISVGSIGTNHKKKINPAWDTSILYKPKNCLIDTESRCTLMDQGR